MQPLTALALAAALTLAAAAPSRVFPLAQPSSTTAQPSEYCYVGQASGTNVCGVAGTLTGFAPVVRRAHGLTLQQCVVLLDEQFRGEKPGPLAESAGYDDTTSSTSSCTLYGYPAEDMGFQPGTSNVTYYDESCLSCSVCQPNLQHGGFDTGKLYPYWQNGTHGSGVTAQAVSPGYFSKYAARLRLNKTTYYSESYIVQPIRICPDARYTMSLRYKAPKDLSGGNATFLIQNNLDTLLTTTSFTGNWQYFKKTYKPKSEMGPNYQVGLGAVSFGVLSKIFPLTVDSVTFELAGT